MYCNTFPTQMPNWQTGRTVSPISANSLSSVFLQNAQAEQAHQAANWNQQAAERLRLQNQSGQAFAEVERVRAETARLQMQTELLRAQRNRTDGCTEIGDNLVCPEKIRVFTNCTDIGGNLICPVATFGRKPSVVTDYSKPSWER
jgi:hypothetical protein